MVVGDNGILAKAQTAKERTNESQSAEENRLADYEKQINVLGRAGSSYKETLLAVGPISSGNVTFKDENNNTHSIDEFDSIRFLYGEHRSDGWCAIQIREYTKNDWKFFIENHNSTTYWTALYGYSDNFIDLCDITNNGFRIANTKVYSIARIYGINY